MIRILVVEDDPLIALDLVDQLAQFGFSVVGIAANVADALALLDHESCDAAVLDINLGNETAAPIAHALGAQQIPFVTLSGYADGQRPPVFSGHIVFSKPVQIEALAAELRRCGPRDPAILENDVAAASRKLSAAP